MRFLYGKKNALKIYSRLGRTSSEETLLFRKLDESTFIFFTAVCGVLLWFSCCGKHGGGPGSVVVTFLDPTRFTENSLVSVAMDRMIVLEAHFVSPFVSGGGNSNIFYFHPDPWGNDPIWLYIWYFSGWVENSNYSLFFFLLHKDVYLLRACDFFKNRLVRVLHSFFNFCHIALARRCAWRDFHLGSGIDFYLKRVFEILRMLWSRWLFFFVDWFWNQRFRDVFGVSQINQRRVFPRRSVTIMGI